MRLPIGVLAAAAVVAPSAAFPQPELDGVADAELRLLETIQEEEAEEGPNSADLVGPLAALGLLHEEQGHHYLAVPIIDRAIDIVRMSYGLHSFAQAPLLRQLVRNAEARGDVALAWELEQELRMLLRRHPDELEAAPIWREIGEKRMDLLRRYLAGEYSPLIVIGGFYGFSGDELHGGSLGDVGRRPRQSGSKRVAVRSILAQAWESYGNAIEVLIRNERYSSEDLRELELELIRSGYAHGNYLLGRQSYRRLISYNAANSEPWLNRVKTLVELADWELLFARSGNARNSALQLYEEAYELLETKGVAQVSIDELFSPESPVLLPTFFDSPFASERTRGSAGHIDVAFDVTADGESRQVEILGATQGASKAAKRDVVRLIKRSRFRPRFTDGKLGDRSRVVVRYYLNEPHREPVR